MDTNNAHKETPNRREYHRKWRRDHPEAVKAAQMRYWAKKAEEMKKADVIPKETEIRNAEEFFN